MTSRSQEGTALSFRNRDNTLDIDLVQVQNRYSIYASLRRLDQKPRMMFSQYLFPSAHCNGRLIGGREIRGGKAHVRVCPYRFSNLTFKRDKAGEKEQQDRSQLCTSCKRIEQPFFILRRLVRRDDVEYLSDEK